VWRFRRVYNRLAKIGGPSLGITALHLLEETAPPSE
jgi:hypothetical protein